MTYGLIKRNFSLVFVPIAVILAVLCYQALFLKPLYVTELLTFSTNVVEGTTNNKPININAVLYMSREAKFPIPTVVITPSSSGIEKEREIYYAIQLTKAGFAALVIDSFSARNVANSLYDQSLLESWQVENDAIAALRHLKKDARFSPKPIAIMGVSKGGTVAMDSASKIRRGWTNVTDVAFSAHIAISPDCTWTMRSDETTGAPILFMLAELDDQTPVQPCLEKAQRLTEAGNPSIETKVYKGVHHAWEEIGLAPQHGLEIENYSNCRVWIEDDGHMVSAETGDLVPEQDWHTWAKQNCMILGATCCGGTPQHKQQATRDIVAFLRKHGF